MTRGTNRYYCAGRFFCLLFSSSAYSLKRKETKEVQRKCANNRVFGLFFIFFNKNMGVEKPHLLDDLSPVNYRFPHYDFRQEILGKSVLQKSVRLQLHLRMS